ncbi:MAG: hypothetical protein E6Q97_26145 [Desulfurellales bacterium]|nr:MAG: hypothetical protein E6Q97_26145 [Desulfurellales bacterium]
MPAITPLAAIPMTAPDSVASASLAFLAPGQIIWLEGRLTGGTVTLRPYYWSGTGGAWLPLDTDATAGNALALDSTLFNGGASGLFTSRRVSAYYVVVEEAAAAPVYDFVHISAESSASPQ